MSKQTKQPDPPALTGFLTMLAVAAVVLLAGLGAIFLVSGGGGGSEAPENAPAASTTDEQNDGTLPQYVMAASEDVQMAYQYAMDRPDVMMWMPCYCGCGEHSGHKSAKNCFIKETSTATNVQFDEHGANCEMCVGIALDTKRMQEEGRSLSEIRTYIDETYGSIGPGTDTPLPPA